MNWTLDKERGCITENAEPVLEGSFNDSKSLKALKLASKAPEMLDMLKILIQDIEEEGNYSRQTNYDLEEAKRLIKEAPTI